MVSLLMIGIAAWGKWFGLVSSFQVVGGVIGVGVFLFIVALVGLVGAMKHHQVLLFFVSFAPLDLWLLSFVGQIMFRPVSRLIENTVTSNVILM